MLWFTVWTVLVVGTLAGAFVLGRRLWRSGLALGRELARAGQTWEQLSDRLAELQALAAENRVDTGPTVLAPRGPLRERRAVLREERHARRADRAEKHARTRQSWRAYWS
ncbi:hypothetical protein OMK64_14320 [Cellulomonas fimi]|uniref:hypothetical protein n=1 Tax=Cellulomonas fimi TaxID=1708 RepID=UPI00234E2F18|nr:hypothetical protein [Cellulomonas fimi]MDC7122709.1 hypothetical protein [Cellulomonas fimi]